MVNIIEALDQVEQTRNQSYNEMDSFYNDEPYLLGILDVQIRNKFSDARIRNKLSNKMITLLKGMSPDELKKESWSQIKSVIADYTEKFNNFKKNSSR